jgi:hypothetical protein
VEYPKEIDYFKLDPGTGNDKWDKDLQGQFRSLYGDNPKSITIMFPKADVEIFFPQWRKRYGAGGVLRCKGDGQSASVGLPEWAEHLEVTGKDARGLTTVVCKGDVCPYTEKGDCKTVGTLNVLLPEIKGVGVWQITTGSWNSIVNMNSAIEWLTSICGRYWMIPLKLNRVAIKTQTNGKARTHHVLQVDQEHFSLADLQRAALADPTRMMLQSPEEAEDDLLADAVPHAKVYKIEPVPVREPGEDPPEPFETPAPEPTVVTQESPKPAAPMTAEKAAKILGGEVVDTVPIQADTSKPASAPQLSAISSLSKKLGWSDEDLDYVSENEVPGCKLADMTYEQAGLLINDMNRRLKEAGYRNGA